jgi:hypothetical protein
MGEQMVVWIMFDSLRLDVYRKCENPILKALRARGSDLLNNRSQSGFTFLSCSSMWSGMNPQNCDVNMIDPTIPFRNSWLGKMDVPVDVLRQKTIFEHLPGSLMFFRDGTSSWQFEAYAGESAFGRNFDSQQAVEIAKKQLRLLHNRNSVLFLRVFDTHLPYGVDFSPVGKGVRNPEVGGMKTYRRRIAELVKSNGPSAAQQLQLDGLNHALDHYIAPILKEITDLCVLDKGTLVISSDHGDQYSAEPTLVGHGRFHSDVVSRVPLLFCGNRIKAQQVERLTRNIDIVPTLLSRLNFSIPEMDGDDLSKTLAGERNSVDEREWFMNTMRGVLAVGRGRFLVAKGLPDHDFHVFENGMRRQTYSSETKELVEHWMAATTRFDWNEHHPANSETCKTRWPFGLVENPAEVY